MQYVLLCLTTWISFFVFMKIYMHYFKVRAFIPMPTSGTYCTTSICSTSIHATATPHSMSGDCPAIKTKTKKHKHTNTKPHMWSSRASRWFSSPVLVWLFVTVCLCLFVNHLLHWLAEHLAADGTFSPSQQFWRKPLHSHEAWSETEASYKVKAFQPNS